MYTKNMAKAKINLTMLYIVISLINTFFLGTALIKLPYIYNYLFLGEKIACEGPGECFGEALIEVLHMIYFFPLILIGLVILSKYLLKKKVNNKKLAAIHAFIYFASLLIIFIYNSFLYS